MSSSSNRNCQCKQRRIEKERKVTRIIFIEGNVQKSKSICTVGEKFNKCLVYTWCNERVASAEANRKIPMKKIGKKKSIEMEGNEVR